MLKDATTQEIPTKLLTDLLSPLANMLKECFKSGFQTLPNDFMRHPAGFHVTSYHKKKGNETFLSDRREA